MLFCNTVLSGVYYVMSSSHISQFSENFISSSIYIWNSLSYSYFKSNLHSFFKGTSCTSVFIIPHLPTHLWESQPVFRRERGVSIMWCGGTKRQNEVYLLHASFTLRFFFFQIYVQFPGCIFYLLILQYVQAMRIHTAAGAGRIFLFMQENMTKQFYKITGRW